MLRRCLSLLLYVLCLICVHDKYHELVWQKFDFWAFVYSKNNEVISDLNYWEMVYHMQVCDGDVIIWVFVVKKKAGAAPIDTLFCLRNIKSSYRFETTPIFTTENHTTP